MIDIGKDIMDPNFEIIEKNNSLCKEIENYLNSFIEEVKLLYLNKYNALLNRFNQGKFQENGIMLYAYSPQYLFNELVMLKEELEDKIRNKEGVITSEYKFKEYLKKMIDSSVKRINPHFMNLYFLKEGILILSDFLNMVYDFLTDVNISDLVKETCFEDISHIIILCCSSEITWVSMINDSLVDQFKKFFINDDKDYSIISDFLVNQIRSGKFNINLNKFSEIMDSKKDLSSANFLISLAILIDYKPILKTHTDGSLDFQDRDRMVSDITNYIQSLDNGELTNFYNSLFPSSHFKL